MTDSEWCDAAGLLPGLSSGARLRITAAVSQRRRALAQEFGQDAAHRARLMVRMRGGNPEFALFGGTAA